MFRLTSQVTGLKVLSFVTAAIIMAVSLAANAEVPKTGQQYFTKYNFMFERGKHSTTNYWRGEMLPINSPVTLKRLSGKKMTLDIGGRDVTFVNAKKHTMRSIEEIASELLSPTEVSVGGEFANDIKAGVMRLGMTKDEVIQTRGYPPRHKTPSLDGRRWVYWSSKFVQLTLVFDQDGKLVEGRGLN